jgi:hypothetical protein
MTLEASVSVSTVFGDIPISQLCIGDRVMTARGGAERVVWIGRRRIRCSRHPRAHDVSPICVRAGAFAEGMPTRDLRLSPDHAILFDNVLIPVRHLINGVTVVHDDAEVVEYCHVELEQHAAVLAEGLSVESYRGKDNRTAYANGPLVALHPDFAADVPPASACAPIVHGGRALARAQRRLQQRAATLGYWRTQNPALAVTANESTLAVTVENTRWRAELPRGTREVWLRSRTWIPAEMSAKATDRRLLGIGISGLWFDGQPIALDDPAFGTGWHTPEPGLRWTDGAACVALCGVRNVEFDLAQSGLYWREAPTGRASRRVPMF